MVVVAKTAWAVAPRAIWVVLALALGAALAGCAALGRGQRGPSLFEQLGGDPGVRAIVEDLIDASVADARIGSHFVNKDIPHLKAMVVEQICSLTGGPCRYTGKDMQTIHTRLEITEADFNAFVEHLRASLDKRGVPQSARNGLLRILAPMRRDILYR